MNLNQPYTQELLYKYSLVFCLSFFFILDASAQSFLNEVHSYQQFEQLSGEPLSAKYGNVTSVKVVVDLKDTAIYYCSSKEYQYHHDFCRKKLKYKTDIETFNNNNYYNSPKRRFLLGNVNHFEDLNLFAIEIAALDLMSSEKIELLYRSIYNSFYEKDSLYFLLSTSRTLSEKPKVKQISPVYIYKNQNFQSISNAKSKGILRFIDETSNRNFRENDIIVLKETPLSLPKVAGVIVSEFQTPLSHLSILGKNRAIPIAAVKDVFNDSSLYTLNNSWVKFEVNGSTFQLTATDSLQRFKASKKGIEIYSNLKIDTLIDLDKLKRKIKKAVGNKAYNFAVLKKLSQELDFKVPESSFAIPFYFYQQHIINSNTNSLIDELLNAQEREISEDSLRIYLKRIRKSILQGELDSNLHLSVKNKITKLGSYTRMRFRSSTNAEDAKGFSGAGLYASKTGDLRNTKKPIDKAIKKVWASLWSFDAYTERSLFGINHRKVYMGILVHRSFPNEHVNGVCISKNLYRKDYPGFVVNAQLGDESVVKPEKGQVTDQFICFPDSTHGYSNKQTDINIITISNLNEGNLTMSESEIKQLANQVEEIKYHQFSRSSGLVEYLDFGLDFEFKVDGPERKLYIKQMRLFND